MAVSFIGEGNWTKSVPISYKTTP